MTRNAIPLIDPWDGQTHNGAENVYEPDLPTHSQLLGPDGNPLPYAPKPRLGFDLTPKQQNRGGT